MILKKGKYLVDPPEGWKYGFPKEFEGEIDTDTIGDWCVEHGYPKKVAEYYGDVFNVRIIEL